MLIAEEIPIPHKAERNRGNEGVPLPPSPAAQLAACTSPEALSLPFPLYPNQASPGQLLQHLALDPPFRPDARRDADVEPRSRRLHSRFLPSRAVPTGREGSSPPRMPGGTGGTRPACRGSRSPVRAGAGSRPSLPPRFKSPLRDPPPPAPSPEMMWPRPVTPTPGHPGRSCRRGAFSPRGPAGAPPGHGPGSAPLPPPRQELFESAPALPRRGGGVGPHPRTHTPPHTATPRRFPPTAAAAAPPVPPRSPAAPLPRAGAATRASPAPRLPAHTPEPPGTGRDRAAGAAGSCSPSTASCRWPRGLCEPRAPTCPALAGGSARAAAHAQGSLKEFPLVFLGRGGRCPELLKRDGTERTRTT